MEIKKLPKADLENKKTIFMQIGIVVALSLVLIASEWSTDDVSMNINFMDEGIIAETEIIPITRTKEIKPPPPPPPPKPADIIAIVKNDAQLKDEYIATGTESFDNKGIDLSNMKVEETREENNTFVRVEEMPEFPGGEAALRKYLANSVKYPQIAKENNIEGRVYIQFVIDKNGEVTEVMIARGVDPSLDREALRVVEAMPLWKPGKQRNKPVRVFYTVPISFVLH